MNKIKDEKTNIPSIRMSSKTQAVKSISRKEVINGIILQLLLEEITQGEALKELRIKVLGLKQDNYANLVNISRKTLSELENNKGNYSSDIINKVFRPFGLKVGLIPSSPHRLFSLLKDTTKINE